MQKMENIKKHVQELFLSYKKAMPCIMQIRYIDKNGYEKIRIDGTSLNVFGDRAISKIVPDSELQDKSKRDYVKKFLNLKPNQVGSSEINLNIEHGIVNGLSHS